MAWGGLVPRLGVNSELHLPAYATATATQGARRICNLIRSSRVLNPLSKARDQTRFLMGRTWVHYC